MGIVETKYNSNESLNDVDDDQYTFQPFRCELHLGERDEELPFPRSGHRIVCDEGNFYSYGGYNPQHTLSVDSDSDNENDVEDPQCLFPQVWKYNFAHTIWTKLHVRNMPSALASNSIILSGKMLIVYGGTGVPFHLTRSNKLYMCNLEDKEPTFKLVQGVGKVPPPLYGQAIFIKDNYLYVMGGTTGFDYFIDIHRFNLQTKEWEEVYIYKETMNDPAGRYRHELAVVDDKVYVIGGGVGREAFDFEQIPVFDITLKTWGNMLAVRDCVNGYPPARQYHSLVRIPETDNFIMVGGMHLETIFDDAWKLEIPSMQWSKICSLRLDTPVYFHASSVTPSGKMFTFGGVSQTPVDNQLRVSHVQSAWIRIPKLKDICWEAVLKYGYMNDFDSEGAKYLPFEYSRRLCL